MTLDERVKALMAELPYANKTTSGVAGFEKKLRLALQQMEHDTRHAAAEAVVTISNRGDLGQELDFSIVLERAHAAVMNVSVK